MIYMRGVNAKDLVAIVDFIYHGEVNIENSDLNGFLKLAGELQLNGLSGSDNETIDKTRQSVLDPKPPFTNLPSPMVPKQDKLSNQPISGENFTKSAFKSALDDWLMGGLQGQIDSMLEKVVTGEYKCTVCGKTKKGRDAKRGIRKHIEVHVNGVTHPCNQCDKVSRTSHGLETHILRFHKRMMDHPCNQCEIVCKTSQRLELHTLKYH